MFLCPTQFWTKNGWGEAEPVCGDAPACFLLLLRERVEKEREIERNRQISGLLFHSFMHSMVESCVCSLPRHQTHSFGTSREPSQVIQVCFCFFFF